MSHTMLLVPPRVRLLISGGEGIAIAAAMEQQE